jgi:mannose-1-phosphate guanylyltransferase
MENNYAVIMAGGVGSRFWPLSTPEVPKQFLDVLGMGKSLIQMTFERLSQIAPAENIFVVTNESYKNLVVEQLPQMSAHNILTEPQRKNTAPCIAYAAAKICAINKDANLIVAPSDHLILQSDKFERIVQVALKESAAENCLVTLGIKPNRPDTGYGYIQFELNGDLIAGSVANVRQFTEKPNRELAELFLKSGDYYWNSGIFVWKAETILTALEKFKPELHQLFTEKPEFYGSDSEQAYVNQCFEVCEDISIDFAVMENAKNVKIVLADFDWSDLGTWGSVYAHLNKDVNGNAIVGGDVKVVDSHNCIINIPQSRSALIQGMNDYIIVEANGKLLILSKKDEQKLKDYLKLMEA